MPLNKYKHCFPGAQQTLLIKVCVAPLAEIEKHWDAWCGMTTPETTSWEEYSLLGMAYGRLSLLDHQVQRMDQLKGAYRRNWYLNKVRMQKVTDFIVSLRALNIAPILLKGSAMLGLYYQDYGVRLFRDIDFLIPYEKISEINTVLKNKGYKATPERDSSDAALQAKLKINQEQGFTLDDILYLDLHVSLLESCLGKIPFSHFSNNAIEVKLNNESFYAVDPTALLFHTIVHGMQHYTAAHIRWAVDAVTIINSDKYPIDWPEFIKLAVLSNRVSMVSMTLMYLMETYHCNIPTEMIDALKREKVEKIDIRLHKLFSSKYVSSSMIFLISKWYHVKAMAKHNGSRSTLVNFMRYLQLNWDCAFWSVPFLFIKKSISNLFRRVL